MLFSPTKWSCLPACLAMIADLTFEEVIGLIGHDGSDVINTDPEPLNRRGFEWQEIIKAALTHGVALVECPDVLPLPGILLGTSDNGIPHACAWNGERIFDPARGRRELNSFRYDSFFLALRISEEDRKKFCETQQR